MAKYVRKVRVAERFDEQEVVFMLTPLRFEDALLLKNANASGVQERDADGKIKGKGEEVIRLYARMFPGYVQSATPFYDANGEQVPLDEIATGLFFVPLLAAVMGKHMAGGHVQDPPEPAAVPAGSSPGFPIENTATSAG